MQTEQHHPSWSWRIELWFSTALTILGVAVAATRDPRLDAAVVVLGTLAAIQVVVLVAAYVREGMRLQREQEQQERARARDHVE